MTETRSVGLPDVAESFLRELAFMLRDAEERDDVLREIRGHLEEVARAAHPEWRAAAVKEAVESLGTVEQIANTATVRDGTGAHRERSGAVRNRLVDILKSVTAFVSIPVALVVPLLGGVFALLVFLWSWMGGRPGNARDWTPIIVSGIGIVLGIAMLLIQLPVSAGPVSVDLPVSPA